MLGTGSIHQKNALQFVALHIETCYKKCSTILSNLQVLYVGIVYQGEFFFCIKCLTAISFQC